MKNLIIPYRHLWQASKCRNLQAHYTQPFPYPTSFLRNHRKGQLFYTSFLPYYFQSSLLKFSRYRQKVYFVSKNILIHRYLLN